MALEKKMLANGQKAFQRLDREDRSLVYRDWLRTVDTNGFWIDLDFVKWKNINGELRPVALTDLTRTDREFVTNAYLCAIIERILYRDKQGYMLQKIGQMLNVPVYLVLYPKSMSWTKVYDFAKKEWLNFTIDGWTEFLKKL